MSLPPRVELCEVGPRDGLQAEEVLTAPPLRAELCRRALAAGVPLVEAVSFVREDRVPAMAEPEAVLSELPSGERLAGLVLNERGYERLRATRVATVHVTFGVSEGFQERNGGSSVAAGVARAAAIAARARVDGRAVTAVLSCAFGCPYDGEIPAGRAAELAYEAAAFSDLVVLADTIGVATPSAVRALVAQVREGAPRVGVHLHDTRGTALAGALAALEAGASRLDGSIGGIGGCPFAPGAQGNVATEDLVYLLEREGVVTGIDLDALVDTARWLSSALGRPLPGRVHRAGPWPA